MVILERDYPGIIRIEFGFIPSIVLKNIFV